jgi:hypothetical protein
MPLCPQITNTPITVTLTTNFIVTDVFPVIPATTDEVNAKAQIYRQTTAPTGSIHSGDVWYDTDDNNKPYYYDGTSWVSVQDGTIAAKNSIFRQTTTPTALAVGDVWYDTDDGNKPYVWTGSAWVSAQDGAIATAQTTADGKNKIFSQTSAPTASAVGDYWVDTDDNNKPYRWNGSSWVSVQDGTIAIAQTTATNAATAAATAQTTANGKNKIFSQTTAPTATAIGDYWVDTDDNNKPYRWNGSAWVSVQDGTIAAAQTTADNAAILAANASTAAATAQTTANGAQTTANGKNTVKYSLSTPSGTGANGDIWFQFNGSNNIIGQWTYNTSSSSWVANQITSTVIANLDAGKITTGTLDATLVSIQSQPSSSDKIIFSGTNNSITFNVAGAARGHIVPMNVGGSSYGVLYHYGSTPNPNGTSYPQAYVGATAALIAGSSTVSLGSTSTENSSQGPFYSYGELYAAGHSTTANAANGYVFTTGGRIARSTASSERYKENIVDLSQVPELDPKKLLDLPVRAFTYKDGELPETDDRYQQLIPGFIAEEVDAIYPIAADYVDGPESWNDRMIVPALLSLVQDLYKRIEKLENPTAN